MAWEQFLQALGGWGAGASQGIAQVGQQNRQDQFALLKQALGFGQQGAIQGRLFEQQSELERMREEAAANRAAQLKLVPIGSLTPELQRRFEQPPPETALERHAIEPPGTIPRPQVQRPTHVDERILPVIQKQIETETMMRSAPDLIKMLTGGGAPGVGTDVRIGVPGMPGTSVTTRGPLREAVATGPESSFVQTHTQHFMSPQGGGLPRVEAVQKSRALWNDERYRTQWMSGAGARAGSLSAELGEPINAPGVGTMPPGIGPGAAAPQPSSGLANIQPAGAGPAEKLAFQRGRGAQKALREEGPVPPSEVAALTQIRSLQRQVANVEANYRPDFVGKGFQGTFGGITGGMRQFLGMVPPEQVVFRKGLKDASDMLLRARSGAQINEQEYQRLAALLPKETDEPSIFEAGLNRFKDEIEGLITDRVQLTSVPRKSVGQMPVRPPISGRGNLPAGPAISRRRPPGPPPVGATHWSDSQGYLDPQGNPVGPR